MMKCNTTILIVAASPAGAKGLDDGGESEIVTS
jgi:hypothetical protein